MLHFNQFEKSFGSTPVIQIPNFTLNKGIYWLQGDNGAGKTTLLKSIAGLIPFTGTIRTQNINIRKQRKRYRELVNWAEAEPVYPDFLTGLDLIAFYKQTLKANPTEIAKLVNAFGATEYLHKRVSTYSSGMTKKLSLLLAFIGKPEWILLDEPLITLDITAVSTCFTLIKDYEQKCVSFLISSHQTFVNTAPFKFEKLFINNKTIAFQ